MGRSSVKRVATCVPHETGILLVMHTKESKLEVPISGKTQVILGVSDKILFNYTCIVTSYT